MSSIQEAMARIQEIMDRIRAIQGLARGPAQSKAADQTVSGPEAARSDEAVQGTGDANRTADFAKLLEQALAAQSATGASNPNGDTTAADLLSAQGQQSALSSLLGADQSGANGEAGSLPLTDFTDALRSYQSTLMQALRQLAAEKEKPNPAP